MTFNVNLYNVILCGIAFLVLFSAYSGSSQASVYVLEAASKSSNGTFYVNGYTSLAICYLTFSLFNWVSPMVVLYLNPRYSMILGAACYVLYIAAFIKPYVWSIYIVSLLVGIGAAIIWTAQGAFIASCADKENTTKYFSLFWGLFQCCQIVGGMFSYLVLRTSDQLTPSIRITMYSVFTVCALIGTLLFLGLRPPREQPELQVDEEPEAISDENCLSTKTTLDISENEGRSSGYVTTVTTDSMPSYDRIGENTSLLTVDSSVIAQPRLLHIFKRSFVLLFTKTMFAVLVCSAFTGFNLTFFSGVLGTCLGHTKQFGNSSKDLIAIACIFLGVGEVIGCLFQVAMKHRDPVGVVAMSGFPAVLIASLICFLQLPADAPLHDTEAVAYTAANVYAIMPAAVLFGCVDSVWNTQISTLITRLFTDAPMDIPVAFSLFKFVQSIMAAVAFFYSPYAPLPWQLAILVIMATVGMAAFFYVAWVVPLQSPATLSPLPETLETAAE